MYCSLLNRVPITTALCMGGATPHLIVSRFFKSFLALATRWRRRTTSSNKLPLLGLSHFPAQLGQIFWPFHDSPQSCLHQRVQTGRTDKSIWGPDTWTPKPRANGCDINISSTVGENRDYL